MSLSTSPILAAAASNDVPGLRWLIEHEQIDPNFIGDWFDETRAAGDVSTSSSAKSNNLSRRRQTPLMVAATHGSLDALNYLLSLGGCDVAIVSDDTTKSTALHCAASGGSSMSKQCVSVLLSHGADGKALDAFGREPSDVLPVPVVSHGINVVDRTGHSSGRNSRVPGNDRVSNGSFSSSPGSSPPTGESDSRSASGSHTSSNSSNGTFGFGPNFEQNAFAQGGPVSTPGNVNILNQYQTSKVIHSGMGDGMGYGMGKQSDEFLRKQSGYQNGQGNQSTNGSSLSSHHSVSDTLDDSVKLSDDFRMFEFKVRRCSRTRAHDWTECPYTHPGEKARRRDPRRFHYGGNACPEFRKGSCPRGDACGDAHGVFECWLHPSRYRTQLCKDGSRCNRRACFFAHRTDQIRLASDAFGNAICGEVSNGVDYLSRNNGGSLLKNGNTLSNQRCASLELSRGTSLDLDGYAGAFGGGLGLSPHFAGVSDSNDSYGSPTDRRRATIDGGSRPGVHCDHVLLGGNSGGFNNSGSGSTSGNSGSGSLYGHQSSVNESSGSGSQSGSGSERGGGSDDGRTFQFPGAMGNQSQHHTNISGYGNGISLGNGGGGPAVAAQALLQGGGGPRYGFNNSRTSHINAVNGLDKSGSSIARRAPSFDSAFDQRNMNRHNQPVGPSLLSSMQTLGIGERDTGRRGRSIDVASINQNQKASSRFWSERNGSGSNNSSNDTSPPHANNGVSKTGHTDLMHAAHNDMRQMLQGGAKGEFEAKDQAPRNGAPNKLGPRNSSFQHLGMIEGVLGDESFLGA